MENQPTVPNEEEKVLFSWRAPERPFKKRDREFFTTVLSIAFLISVIMFFLQGALPVAVIISLVFLVYVLSTVPPNQVEHKITNKGIYFAGVKRPWEGLSRFWFTKRFGNDLVVFEALGAPGRIEMVFQEQDKSRIQAEVGKFLALEEAEPTFLDKGAAWLSKRIPLEG